MHPANQIFLSLVILSSGVLLLVGDASVNRSHNDTIKCISADSASQAGYFLGLAVASHVAMTVSGCAMLVVSLADSSQYMAMRLKGKQDIYLDPERFVMTSMVFGVGAFVLNFAMAITALVIFFETKDRSECLRLPSLRWVILSLSPGFIVMVTPILGMLAALFWFVYLIADNVVKFATLIYRSAVAPAHQKTG